MKKRILSILLIFALLLTLMPAMTTQVAAAEAEGSTYYVDGVSGSDSANGTVDQPFQTLSKALGAITTTGTIVLKSDLEITNTRHTISSGKDITIDFDQHKIAFIASINQNKSGGTFRCEANAKLTMKNGALSHTVTYAWSNGSSNAFEFLFYINDGATSLTLDHMSISMASTEGTEFLNTLTAVHCRSGVLLTMKDSTLLVENKSTGFGTGNSCSQGLVSVGADIVLENVIVTAKGVTGAASCVKAQRFNNVPTITIKGDCIFEAESNMKDAVCYGCYITSCKLDITGLTGEEGCLGSLRTSFSGTTVNGVTNWVDYKIKGDMKYFAAETSLLGKYGYFSNEPKDFPTRDEGYYVLPNLDEETLNEGYNYTVRTHIHNVGAVAYSTDQHEMTVTCGEDHCDWDDDELLVSMVTEDRPYNSQAYVADVLGMDDLLAIDKNYSVVYFKDGVQLAQAPVNAGEYRAMLAYNNDVGEEGSQVYGDFEILRQTWETKPEVKVTGFHHGKYDPDVNYPTNSAGITEHVTYYFNTSNSNEGGTPWTADALNDLASGQTYYVYAVFDETDNMDGLTTDAFPFSVSHEHTYAFQSVTGSSNKIKVVCTAEEAFCNDARELTLKIDNAPYTGNPYVPAGVTRFIQEAGDASALTVTYKQGGNVLETPPTDAGEYSAEIAIAGSDVTASGSFKIMPNSVAVPKLTNSVVTYNGKAQTPVFSSTSNYTVVSSSKSFTEVGTYQVEIALSNKNNYVWDDAEIGSDNITYTFEIQPRRVKKPAASTSEYFYDGGYQIYGYKDGSINYYSKDYSVSNYYRAEAGSQTVTVALKDKNHTTWTDGTSGDLSFTLTVQPLPVPVPVADPRTFYADGSAKTFYPFYIVGNNYYCFEGVFYKTVNNVRTDVGTQQVTVTPAENFAWEDGTGTTPKTFNFTVNGISAYGQINCLINKQTGEYTDGYVYGSYMYDKENVSNMYVTTHFKPYIYTSPSNASYEVYYTTDPNNLDRSHKWSELTYTQINASAKSTYYYIYAVIRASGYQDYVTRPYPVCVYKPTQGVVSCKSFACKVPSTRKVRVNKFFSYDETVYVDSTENRPVRSRSFIELPEAGASIIKDLQNGCSVVSWQNLDDGKMANFLPKNINAVRDCFGVGSLTATMTLMGQTSPLEVEPSEYNLTKLDLTEECLAIFTLAGEELEDYMLFGDNVGYIDNLVKADANAPDKMPIIPETIDQNSECTVTFDKLFIDQTLNETDSVYTTVKTTIGSTIEEPEAPAYEYEFKGWYYIPLSAVSEDREVSLTRDGVKWDFDTDTVADNIVLYALYDQNRKASYEVTVADTQNGSVSASPEKTTAGRTVTLTVIPDRGYTLETLTVTGKNGREVELTATTIGETYTFTMPSSKVTVEATFMEDNTMLNFFVDVDAADYYYDAVLWAAENGITSGVDNLHFGPSSLCSRAQAVTLLWRAAGSPAATNAAGVADVPEGEYYSEAVAWAFENGITSGTGNGFSPYAPITRAQFITFLWRAAGSPVAKSTTSFADVPEDEYYSKAVAWAFENGITSGTGSGFSPNAYCDRAQIITFLYRYFAK